ncbi:MAG: sulfatase [Armatimonadota bacterium]
MSRPNIVFLHVDQMHHQAISAYGCRYAHTPSLDRIVAEGYSLMNMHCAMPQCCPSRASWFTGRMSKEHGVVVNGYPLDPRLPDLGQWLRQHGGYETVYTGKWHVSGRNVADSFHVLHRGTGHGELSDSEVARSAVAYLANRTGDQPFFLSVGFLNPHDCCFPATAHGGPGKYAFAPSIKDELPPLPGNFDHDYPDHGMLQVRNWSLQDWQYYIYSYYRMVEMVDREVGRVYAALRSSRHADNTLFIFTSDHGDGAGFHAKVSKGYLEEEAWRVPAIVSWPERIAGGQRDAEHLASGVDIAATICDYAEVPPLPKMSIARSWRPLLEGAEVRWRDYVVGETSIGPLSLAIRDARYKTIFYQEQTKLYDIANDPLETRDLAADPGHAQVLRRHRQHFRDYLEQIEVYPEPTWGQEHWSRGNLYKAYVDWYAKVKAEA